MNVFEFRQPSSTTAQAKNFACDLESVLEKEKPAELRIFTILERLQEKNLLDQEISRVKNLYRKDLGSFEAEFGEDGWEMLTALDVFDQGTAIHSINTYLTTKKKVEKKLWNGVVLVHEFNREQVTLSQFYRACVLHDIGKIEVPHAVLTNRATDRSCGLALFEHKDEILIPLLRKKRDESFSLPETIKSSEDLLSYLQNELHIRPQSISPIKLLLPQPIDEEVIAQLTHCGCTLEDSLTTIMQKHDEYSKKILQKTNYPVEAELAGAHHKHKSEAIRYKTTVNVLRTSVDLADIVHLADVENAILSKRSYKEGKTVLEALKVLSLHSTLGLIEGYIAYIWIADEMNAIKEQKIEEDDQKNFNDVVQFLEEEHIKNPTWPDWKVDYLMLKEAA